MKDGRVPNVLLGPEKIEGRACMNIDPKDELAGFPILEIRRLLKKSRGGAIDEGRATKLLGVTLPRAQKLIQDLKKQGYLEKVKEGSLGFQGWNLTVKANALSNASAAKPITRVTADKKLNEFFNRVEKIRTDSNYLYKVKSVHIFGSYSQQKERISDIDLAIELQPKEPDPKKLVEFSRQRIATAIDLGKSFGNIFEELSWPQTEVWNLLKSRSRCLSLHDFDKDFM